MARSRLQVYSDGWYEFIRRTITPASSLSALWNSTSISFNQAWNGVVCEPLCIHLPKLSFRAASGCSSLSKSITNVALPRLSVGRLQPLTHQWDQARYWRFIWPCKYKTESHKLGYLDHKLPINQYWTIINILTSASGWESQYPEPMALIGH